MRIAVNTRLLIKNKMDGIGLFTYESFKKIVLNHPEIEFVFIFDRTPDPSFLFANNITPIKIGPPTRHILLIDFWFQVSLKRLLKKLKPDVFVGCDGMLPLNIETKTLAVIHDLNFEHHPEQLPKNVRNFYLKYFPKFASQATRIATVSEFSKTDIIKTYHIAPEKVDVVYNGANENFQPVSNDIANKIKSKYASGNNYFLFVGTLHPRKNLIRLFQAFNEFKEQSSSDFKLLIVGKKMWWTQEIENIFNGLKHKNDIVFVGRVNDQDLYNITASAYALTYVPIFEGFGIPLVETMSCGVPVIASNITSMPEVVENAGLLVDPFSVKEITEAMINIVSDHHLRDSLAEKSKIQAQKYSWDKTSQLLWDSIQKTIYA